MEGTERKKEDLTNAMKKWGKMREEARKHKGYREVSCVRVALTAETQHKCTRRKERNRKERKEELPSVPQIDKTYSIT